MYPGADTHNAGPTATGVNLKDMGPGLKETQTEIWILISCHLWCDLGKTNWSRGLQVRVGSTQNGTTSQLKTVIILTIMLLMSQLRRSLSCSDTCGLRNNYGTGSETEEHGDRANLLPQ